LAIYGRDNLILARKLTPARKRTIDDTLGVRRGALMASIAAVASGAQPASTATAV
jgi:hypothetical protein